MTGPDVREAAVAQVQQFTYGAFNPIAACLVAFLGSFLGLLGTGRARAARTRSRRTRWLVIAAFSIGGAGIWLMHFVAMLGFDVPASPVRYDATLTLVSLLFAVFSAGVGLQVVGHGRRSRTKTAFAGVLTGVGLLAMHYTGMAAMRIQGTLHFRSWLVAASALVAIVAATTALWFAVTVRGWAQIAGASAVLSLAFCGMHYLAMAAMDVELSPHVVASVGGMRPLVMIVPITLISATTILGVALSALQAMTEEEFTHGVSRPAPMVPARRRPSPRPAGDGDLQPASRS
jgi:NO-binding membrane sensor protein with MHYT domain